MIEHDIDIKSIFEIFINFIFDMKLSFFFFFFFGDLAEEVEEWWRERESE